jgi:2-oxo-4-hydroxy-4-carboxy--5-ureidoimidazoline (OHCU) decarboxylase
LEVSIDELDRATEEHFFDALAPLFEGAPRFLARLAAARPFGSFDRLFERARTITDEMPEDEQIELVDAHPRLGAPPGSVSAHSFVEQGFDQEVDADAATRERGRIDLRLAALNDAYEARFGFRYCVFVAGRSREELIPEMEAALERDRHEELRRALRDVVTIAEARHGRRRTGASA